MAYLGANAAWHMGQWEEMATYVAAVESEDGPELSTGSFLSAVLNVRHGNFGAARGMCSLGFVIRGSADGCHTAS